MWFYFRVQNARRATDWRDLSSRGSDEYDLALVCCRWCAWASAKLLATATVRTRNRGRAFNERRAPAQHTSGVWRVHELNVSYCTEWLGLLQLAMLRLRLDYRKMATLPPSCPKLHFRDGFLQRRTLKEVAYRTARR